MILFLKAWESNNKEIEHLRSKQEMLKKISKEYWESNESSKNEISRIGLETQGRDDQKNHVGASKERTSSLKEIIC